MVASGKFKGVRLKAERFKVESEKFKVGESEKPNLRTNYFPTPD